MAIVISSVGTKGGTGKTSLVKHLGIIKREQGKKVLLIDLCQNSDIATRLGYGREDFKYDTHDWVSGKVPFKAVVQYDEETGIDFIPASNEVEKILEFAQKSRTLRQEFVLKEKIDQIANQYDYIFIDNHPTETNKMMIMSLLASELALVPMVMDLSSVVATIRTVEIIQSLQKEGIDIAYSVVPNAVDFSKGFKKELLAIKEELTGMGIDRFSSAVRFSTIVQRAGLKREEVIKMDNPYMQNVLNDYRVIANEIDNLIKGTQKD